MKDDVTGLAQAALRWVLEDQNVSLVLSGSRHLNEITDSAHASELVPFSNAQMDRARELHVKDYPPA